MYLLLTITQFFLLFNLRREHVPGPARCAGPVGERRGGQEHHHHRVSPGSQARWEEGEFKDQQCVCASAYRVTIRTCCYVVILFRKRSGAVQETIYCNDACTSAALACYVLNRPHGAVADVFIRLASWTLTCVDPVFPAC